MTATLPAQSTDPFPQFGVLLRQRVDDAPEGAMTGQGCARINHRGRLGADINYETRSRIRIQQHAKAEIQDGRAHRSRGAVTPPAMY